MFCSVMLSEPIRCSILGGTRVKPGIWPTFSICGHHLGAWNPPGCPAAAIRTHHHHPPPALISPPPLISTSVRLYPRMRPRQHRPCRGVQAVATACVGAATIVNCILCPVQLNSSWNHHFEVGGQIKSRCHVHGNHRRAVRLLCRWDRGHADEFPRRRQREMEFAPSFLFADGHGSHNCLLVVGDTIGLCTKVDNREGRSG
jgi:hypothetical protein